MSEPLPPLKSLRLAEKLLQIRKALNFSQSQILAELGFRNQLFRSNISQYELGNREPALTVLLAYARLANIYVDVLIDDALDLPEHLPSPAKSPGREQSP